MALALFLVFNINYKVVKKAKGFYTNIFFNVYMKSKLMEDAGFVKQHKSNLEYLSRQGVAVNKPVFEYENRVAFELPLSGQRYNKVIGGNFSRLYFSLHKDGGVTVTVEVGNEDNYSGVPIPLTDDVSQQIKTIQGRVDTLNARIAELLGIYGTSGFHFRSDRPTFFELTGENVELVYNARSAEDAHTSMLKKLDELTSE